LKERFPVRLRRVRLTLTALVAGFSILLISGSAIGGSACTTDGGGGNYACCKVCTTGKACGDTCISRSYECHVGPGCACDG